MWLARFRSLYPAIRQPLSPPGSEDAAVAPGAVSGPRASKACSRLADVAGHVRIVVGMIQLSSGHTLF